MDNYCCIAFIKNHDIEQKECIYCGKKLEKKEQYQVITNITWYKYPEIKPKLNNDYIVRNNLNIVFTMSYKNGKWLNSYGPSFEPNYWAYSIDRESE